MNGPTYVTTRDAATAVGVTIDVVRMWAYRGKLERQGRDHRNRTLYLLADVRAVAKQQRARAGKTRAT